MSDTLEIPKASTKRIMKLNNEVELLSAVSSSFILLLHWSFWLDARLCVLKESIVATTRAAELFVGMLAEQAHQIAAFNNRKTIKVTDLLNCVCVS